MALFRMLKYPVPYPLPGHNKAACGTAHVVGYGHRARERLHTRLLPEERELIERAALITGCALSEFMRWSGRFVAESVIKEFEEQQNERTSK